MTNEQGKPDSLVGPEKLPNKAPPGGGRGNGGKRVGQREPVGANHAPDPEPGKRAKCARTGTPSSNGERVVQEVGTVQGGCISLVLANIYLHYVFDVWAHRWRRKQARGEIYSVRFADDVAAGFQYRHEAEGFLEDLKQRFSKFALQLHPEKTRLIEFGRFAAENRRNRDEGKRGTFIPISAVKPEAGSSRCCAERFERN